MKNLRDISHYRYDKVSTRCDLRRVLSPTRNILADSMPGTPRPLISPLITLNFEKFYLCQHHTLYVVNNPILVILSPIHII